MCKTDYDLFKIIQENRLDPGETASLIVSNTNNFYVLFNPKKFFKHLFG